MKYLYLFLALFTLASPALAIDLINTLPGGDATSTNYDFIPNRLLYKEGQSFRTTASEYTVTSVTVPLSWQWDAPSPIDFDYSINLAEFNTSTNLPGSVIASQTFNTSGLSDQTYTNVTWNLNQTLGPNTSYYVTVGANVATGITTSNTGLRWGYNNGTYTGWGNNAGVAPVGGTYWAYFDAPAGVWSGPPYFNSATAGNTNFPQLLRVTADTVPVPEPSTYVSALLGVGAVLLVIQKRKARKCVC